MSNGNEPATPLIDDKISTHTTDIYYGMTKREMMAMHIMASLTQGGAISEIGNEQWYASRACDLADSLLKELEIDTNQ